jgi:3-(3-hydroxy-phenyl)propionate hydroxylase
MRSFRHGRLLFVGDAAHVVSPFGARGANSGIQDVDNLGWKLELVVGGLAPERLLDSFDAERTAAADENIRNSTRSTDFITPKSNISRTFRDAVLMLSKRHPFARRLVNSGRLSLPATLGDSPLNTPDAEPFAGRMVPGAPAVDAPVTGDHGAWLLDYLGDGFALLLFIAAPLPQALLRELAALGSNLIPCRSVLVGAAEDTPPEGMRQIADPTGLLAERYDARPETVYLFRPDQHVCARWRAFDLVKVCAAIAKATAHAPVAERQVA